MMVFAIGVTVGLVRCILGLLFVLLDFSCSLRNVALFQLGLFVDFFVRLFNKLKFTVVGDCIL